MADISLLKCWNLVGLGLLICEQRGLDQMVPRPLWALTFIFLMISEEVNEILRHAFFLFKLRGKKNV